MHCSLNLCCTGRPGALQLIGGLMPLRAGRGQGGYCPFVPAGRITLVRRPLTIQPPPGKGRTNLLSTNVRGSQLITNLIKATGGSRGGRGGQSVGGRGRGDAGRMRKARESERKRQEERVQKRSFCRSGLEEGGRDERMESVKGQRGLSERRPMRRRKEETQEGNTEQTILLEGA